MKIGGVPSGGAHCRHPAPFASTPRRSPRTEDSRPDAGSGSGLGRVGSWLQGTFLRGPRGPRCPLETAAPPGRRRGSQAGAGARSGSGRPPQGGAGLVRAAVSGAPEEDGSKL